MSYVTIAVNIEEGQVVPHDPEGLPLSGRGLLTLLPAEGGGSGSPRPFGLARGEFIVPQDFNAPLPEEVLRGFEGT